MKLDTKTLSECLSSYLLQPPRPIIDTGDMLPSAPMGPTTSAFRHFASVPSPLAAMPPIGSSPRSSLPETNTMRRVPPSPTLSNNDRAYSGRNITQRMTSSPTAMSNNRQNTYNSTDDALVSPLDIMTLDDPDFVYNRLESSARDFTTWLRMLQTSLDDILAPTTDKESPAQEEDDVVADTHLMHA